MIIITFKEPIFLKIADEPVKHIDNYIVDEVWTEAKDRGQYVRTNNAGTFLIFPTHNILGMTKIN